MLEEKVYSTLKTNNCNPYWSGQYSGVCKSNYTVIRGPSGVVTNKAAKNDILDIILYSPRPQLDGGQYKSVSDILAFKAKVQGALKALNYKQVSDTPIIADDIAMAYTCSIQYQVYRRRD